MYIKNNSPQRKHRIKAVLKEYGKDERNCTAEDRELADCTAQKTLEAVKSLNGGKKSSWQYDELKIAVENMSGGANTVIYDDVGMPSIVVALPKQRICDLYESDDTTVHPAWIVDGKIYETIYVSKYMNFVKNNRAYSLPMCDPHTYFTFDDANQFCMNKGRGWHLMTNASWAAIAAWCKKNGTIPRGNTAMGYSHEKPYEKGVASKMFYHDVQLTKSGSGPVTWTHNHSESGICDLVGNMFEWVGGLRLMNSEIQIIPEATSAMYSEEAYKKDSRRWRAITSSGDLAAHHELDTLKFDATVPGDSFERDHLLNGVPILSTELKNKSYTGEHINGNQGYVECRFSELKAENGLKVPDILKYLAVFPDENCTEKDGIFVVRNYGERVAVRGGKAWSLDRAGLNALHFYNPRTYDGSATIGFRCSYIDL